MPGARRDVVCINELSLTVLLPGDTNWTSKPELPRLQPVIVTLSLVHDLRAAADNDDLSRSINYSSIYAALTRGPPAEHASLEALSDHIFAVAFSTYPEVQEAAVKVVQMKFPLHCRAAGIETRRLRSGVRMHATRFFFEDLVCHGIIGVNTYERVQKQSICLNVSLEISQKPLDLSVLAKRIYNVRLPHALHSCS